MLDYLTLAAARNIADDRLSVTALSPTDDGTAPLEELTAQHPLFSDRARDDRHTVGAFHTPKPNPWRAPLGPPATTSKQSFYWYLANKRNKRILERRRAAAGPAHEPDDTYRRRVAMDESVLAKLYRVLPSRSDAAVAVLGALILAYSAGAAQRRTVARSKARGGMITPPMQTPLFAAEGSAPPNSGLGTLP